MKIRDVPIGTTFLFCKREFRVVSTDAGRFWDGSAHLVTCETDGGIFGTATHTFSADLECDTPPVAPIPQPPADALIVGELIWAGTREIFSGEGEVTGLFVRMTVEELRAVKHLPMYQRVAIIPQSPAA